MVRDGLPAADGMLEGGSARGAEGIRRASGDPAALAAASLTASIAGRTAGALDPARRAETTDMSAGFVQLALTIARTRAGARRSPRPCGGGRAGSVPGIDPAPPASLGGGRRGGVPPPSSVPGFHGVSRAFHARGPTPRAMDAASRRSPEQGPGRRRTAAEPLGRCAGAGSVAPVPPGGRPLARSGSRGAGAPPSLGPRGPRPTRNSPPRRALRRAAAAPLGRTGAAPAPFRDGPARGSRPRPGRPARPFRP